MRSAGRIVDDKQLAVAAAAAAATEWLSHLLTLHDVCEYISLVNDAVILATKVQINSSFEQTVLRFTLPSRSSSRNISGRQL